jgi:hypothetical protein
MIIRTVLCSAVLVLAGLLFVVLSGQLWNRYQEQTAALGFSGVYERSLAAWAGFADDPQGYRAIAEAPHEAPPVVQKASALEE